MCNFRLISVACLTVSLSAGASAWAQSGRPKQRGTLSSRTSALRALPPMGNVQKVIETQLVMGRVGVVRVSSVTLRSGRTSTDKPLAVVAEGTNLAVLMEKEGYYGVLMQDSTMGWVMSGAVEMLDYRVQVKLSKAVVPPEAEEIPQTQSGSETESAPESQISDPRIAACIREAFTYLGVPYVWAGNTRRGLDCSAFVKNVFSTTRGISLPRHSGDQARVGSPVASTDDLQPGDRLYFDMGKKGRVSHCGIYLGNGYFIHASSNRHCVGVDRLTTGNYWGGLVAARRDP